MIAQVALIILDLILYIIYTYTSIYLYLSITMVSIIINTLVILLVWGLFFAW